MKRYLKLLLLYIKILIYLKNPLIVLLNELKLLKEDFVIIEFRKTNLKFKVRANASDMKDIIFINIDTGYILSYLNKVANSHTVLDLGAHLGSFSILCAYYRKDLKIISIEPSTGDFELLKYNIKLNNLEENIVPHNLAVGDFDSTGTFSVEGSSDSWKLIPETTNQDKKEIVNVARIHTIIKDELESNTVGLVKMDIEGGEYSVLPSMVDIFVKIPILMLEFHPDESDETFKQSKARLEKLFAQNKRRTSWSNDYTIVTENI